MQKTKLVIVLGPTAVGKSQVAIELAVGLQGEIVNGDSQQVYRYMDIGTGKPGPAERAKVPHHLIDVVDPDEEFNVALFRHKAAEAVSHIRARGKQVIVCGGTGLYLKALTKGLFVGPGKDANIRQALESEIKEQGLGFLYDRLGRIDAVATSWIHPNDRQRIIRALEVYEVTGKPMSEWQKEHAFRENPFDILKIGLAREREELYALINRRCDRMIEEGLVNEVKRIVASGYPLDLKALRSVGYRHMGLFLTGAMSLEKALDLMKRDTHRLAKRQLTWFRQDREIQWLHPDKDRRAISEAARRFL